MCVCVPSVRASLYRGTYLLVKPSLFMPELIIFLRIFISERQLDTPRGITCKDRVTQIANHAHLHRAGLCMCACTCVYPHHHHSSHAPLSLGPYACNAPPNATRESLRVGPHACNAIRMSVRTSLTGRRDAGGVRACVRARLRGDRTCSKERVSVSGVSVSGPYFLFSGKSLSNTLSQSSFFGSPNPLIGFLLNPT